MGNQTDNTVEKYRQLADAAQKADPNSFHSVAYELKAKGIHGSGGFEFEEMVVQYLKLDPQFKDRFKDVLLWSEYQESDYSANAGREHTGDLGIDIVAIESGNAVGTKDNQRCGIQCKFYDFEADIKKEEVDPWLASIAKSEFASGMFVYTGKGLTAQAREQIRDHKEKLTVINQDTLSQSKIKWVGLGQPGNAPEYIGEKFDPKPHQANAIEAARKEFDDEDASRAHMTMACGTGKTFTALKISEAHSNKTLVLVPSISLVQQTLTEWREQSDENLDHKYIVVCSDKSAGNSEDDLPPMELLIHPTTDAKTLAKQMKDVSEDDFLVVFSTYQSIQVAHEAQTKFDAPDFDLVIADEAHRTTGLERGAKKGQENSHFVRINEGAKKCEAEYVKSDKRLYMTATEKVYAEGTQAKAKSKGYGVFTMDNEETYGKKIYDFTFQQAIDNGILTDYEVLVVTVAEEQYKSALEGMVQLENNQYVDAEKATLGFGIIDAVHEYGIDSCIMFNHRIDASKEYMKVMPELCEVYNTGKRYDGVDINREIEVHHIDGTNSAGHRSEEVRWLSTPQENLTRIITNAKCFSEGVDIPSLEAICFVSARASITDCIQSVGRIMRKAEGKEKGYVILPVVASEGETEDGLAERIAEDVRYKNIWTTLQALRSHDDRFNEELNKGDLSRLNFISAGMPKNIGQISEPTNDSQSRQMELFRLHADFNSAIKATVISSLSSERYWKIWSEDVAEVFDSVGNIVRTSIANAGNKDSFDKLLEEFSAATQIDIDEENGVNLIASHIISKPIFEAIYPNYNLAENNPISRAIEKAHHEILPDAEVARSMASLAESYESIGRRAANIQSEEKKIEFIKSLYESFIHEAMTAKAEKLGVAYTPLPLVDFVLRSAKSILKKELDMDLGKEANIYDPFSGTGVFLSRLIALEELIANEDIESAYKERLHCKEFILLAYYVGDLLIEQAYNYRTGKVDDFDNAFMGDSFATDYEIPAGSQAALFDQEAMEEASEFDKKKFQAILTNPPYSAGQKSSADDNQNDSYPELEDRMEETYGAEQDRKGGKKDSWLKGLRMATDKINKETGGLVSFIHPASWIEAPTYQGMRRHLVKEFDAIYVYNLRGNKRIGGEEGRREGGQTFGSAAAVPICVSVFVKHPSNKHNEDNCNIYYKAIADYATAKDKLGSLNEYGDMLSIKDFTKIVPDEHGEWLNQADPKFFDMGSLENIFSKSLSGTITAYDEIAVNSSKEEQIERTRKELETLLEWHANGVLTPEKLEAGVAKSSKLICAKMKGDYIEVLRDDKLVTKSAYRPFFTQYMRSSFTNINSQGKPLEESCFPHEEHGNVMISTDSKGNIMATDQMMSFHHNPQGKNYSLYVYTDGVKESNISDKQLSQFHSHYRDETISTDDVFYYILGCLASSSFHDKWKTSRVKAKHCHVPFAKNFKELVEAGRKIADLHLKLNSIDSEEPGLDLQEIQTIPNVSDDVKYRIGEKKMKYNAEKGELKINDALTIAGIPKEMDEWVYNEKSAIGWIVDRYVVSYGKTAEIKNDPNLLFDTPDGFVKHLSRVARLTVECLAIQRSLAVEVDDEATVELVEGSHRMAEDSTGNEVIDTQANTVAASVAAHAEEVSDLNSTQTPPSMNGTIEGNPSIAEIDRQMAELQALKERVLANSGQEVEGGGRHTIKIDG